MADPRSNSADDVDPTIAAREREVERNREQLAETVDALHDKLDVKAHAQASFRDVKAQVTTADGKPKPVVLAVAAVLVLVTTVLAWRRRR